ncbi:malonyl-ACP O-methyltransferase BioC [Haliea sp. E1-2-M8]|uniref:malonyl-ACP O-methyltransferase BioC n=1 Tax=Haliea sp. E1-2-M8 TaxID=3064706 RepID=UPI002715838C|nr:malonyl-ACP O-methyltransferase BioC [Haliea sp. E1-2-M8]MDO8860993.1 malonyl-ACP O-methyltransferase BioC [Haliea sp. E1-2-M8]
MPENPLRLEHLPATGTARCDLVLLHGWAGGRDCWRPLLPALRPWANLTLIDWQAATDGLDALVANILAVAPEQAIYVGWSLGGQVATAVAAAVPERVSAHVTIASNPCFTAQPGWPGLPATTLQTFADDLAANPARMLRRFASLQASGDAAERTLARQLLRSGGHWSADALAAGLQWLKSLDTRALLRGLGCPQLHLLAATDALVPALAATALAATLADKSRASVRVLDADCHALPLSAPLLLADALREFVAPAAATAATARAAPATAAPARAAPATAAAATPVAKGDIAASFSRAAARYDSVAALQQDVGQRLLGRIGELGQPATVLDLGCGTGYIQPQLRTRFPQSRYLGMDIAVGMLAYARGRHPSAGSWVAGDAEALPLACESVGLVYSSLAFQWCYRPDLLFAELGRVLEPGGSCFFSSLGPATLQELRQSWAAADSSQHVNSFLPVDALQAAASAVRGVRLQLHSERIVMRYERVGELLAELKTLGAHNMNTGRSGGLTGRRRLAAMIQAYEDWREPEGLPATYDVLFGHLEKL